MGAITALAVFAIRLTWLICFGLWLGAAYFVLMLLLSPFGTLSSGRVAENTSKIMWLKTD